mgnify:CR=1 FL=1|jgi:hypothetical protein|tara:strand:- start:1019 stop:1858 length:840 start_codon:yes stop_codon:yes gene_type:complete
MKTIIKITFLFLISLSLTSCLVDDTDPTGEFDQGVNVVGFTSSTMNLSGVANGSEYDSKINFEVKGPTSAEYSAPINSTISVDPSSTAVEGKHYRLDSSTITLDADGNYSGSLPITLITEGIAAPLAESPILILEVTSADGETNLLPNGIKLTITLNYLCFSNLAGTYNVAMRYVRSASGIDANYAFTDVITETGDGKYRTGLVGAWTAAQLGGTPGMTFNDVCNDISVPYQNLVDLYSNIVEGVAGKSIVNPETGAIYFEYTICATDCREYFVTYTPQ